MIAYRLKLADYLLSQKVIAENFFAAAAAAEETCESATHSLTTNTEQNAAQATFKSQFRDAHDVRTAALEALGPPPVMPFGYELTGNSHESHKIAPYGSHQEISISSLEKFL